MTWPANWAPWITCALQAKFGWVLAGNTDPLVTSNLAIVTHLISVKTGDELIQKFWELEEVPINELNLSLEEKSVMQHFTIHHSRTTEGQFVVPLPRKADAKPLGKSQSQAVRRFLSLE